MRPKDDRIVRSTTRTTRTYTVNGVRYERLEDIPAEFRKLFEDKDGNGVPDVVDAMTKGLEPTSENKVTTVRFETTSSTSASSLSSLPPDLRRIVQRELRDGKATSTKFECSQCGYDLTGTAVGGKCPECGTDVSATIQAMTERPASSWPFGDESSSFRARFTMSELWNVLLVITAIAVVVVGLIFLVRLLG